MAFGQYTKRDWTSVAAAARELENSKGCFDCNICLDLAHEPVVTLCGHLYCWPCIYQWLHTQSASLSSDEHPQCPVCKAGISHTTMVPLYGRGNAQTDQGLKCNAPQLGLVIPARPSAFGTQEALALASTNSITGQQLQYRNPYQSQQYNIPDPYGSHEEEYSPSLFNLGRNGAAGFSHPVAGMFGEMVYARVFGNSNRLGAYPNSYHAVGSNSLRLRRLEMQADKSLNRISIFLLCCFVLCLLLF